MAERPSGRTITRHDLRTPLTAILGFSQLLEMEDLTPANREAVDQIQAAGQRLLNMIQELPLDDGC